MMNRTKAVCLALMTATLAGCAGATAGRNAMAHRDVSDELGRDRDSLLVRSLALVQRVAELTASTERLRLKVDSLAVQGDSLRQGVARLQDSLRERDDQLQAARQELQRLKEIDLKPAKRPPH